MTNDSNCCVYKHTAPNGKVYIGITSKPVQKRWGKHGSGYCRNTHFFNAIKKYGWDSFTHEVLFSGLTREDAANREVELIKKYKSNDPVYGYNLTSGGEQHMTYSPETIEKMRMAKIGKYAGKNNPRYGAKVSEETREKLRKSHTGLHAGEKNPNYGKTMTEEQKQKISIARKGKHFPKLSESMRTSPRRKELARLRMRVINQYDLDGTYIKTWDSAADAAEFIVGRRGAQCNICSCANGNLKTAYGYIWKYPDVVNGGDVV